MRVSFLQTAKIERRKQILPACTIICNAHKQDKRLPAVRWANLKELGYGG